MLKSAQGGYMPGLTITQFRSKRSELLSKTLVIEGEDAIGPITFRGQIESIDKAHFPGLVIILDNSEAMRPSEGSFSACNKLSLVLKIFGWSKFWQEKDGTIIFPSDVSDFSSDFEYRKIYVRA